MIYHHPYPPVTCPTSSLATPPSFCLQQPFTLLLFLEHIRYISKSGPLYFLFPLPQMLFLQLPECQDLSLILGPYSKTIFSVRPSKSKMSSPHPEIFHILLPCFVFFHLSTYPLCVIFCIYLVYSVSSTKSSIRAGIFLSTDF